MKKLCVIAVLFAVMFFSSCSTHIDEAISYNEAVVLCYNKVADVEERLIYYLLTSDTLKFNEQLANFKKQLDLSSEELRGLGAFQGDDGFQKEGIAMLDAFKEITLKELPGLMTIILKTDTTGTDTLHTDTLFESGLNEYESKIGEAFDKFVEAQQRFAAKYSFKLE